MYYYYYYIAMTAYIYIYIIHTYVAHAKTWFTNHDSGHDWNIDTLKYILYRMTYNVDNERHQQTTETM